jgi:hypothetical protein
MSQKPFGVGTIVWSTRDALTDNLVGAKTAAVQPP